jgi:hypothetical protein
MRAYMVRVCVILCVCVCVCDCVCACVCVNVNKTQQLLYVSDLLPEEELGLNPCRSAYMCMYAPVCAKYQQILYVSDLLSEEESCTHRSSNLMVRNGAFSYMHTWSHSSHHSGPESVEICVHVHVCTCACVCA